MGARKNAPCQIVYPYYLQAPTKQAKGVYDSHLKPTFNSYSATKDFSLCRTVRLVMSLKSQTGLVTKKRKTQPSLRVPMRLAVN